MKIKICEDGYTIKNLENPSELKHCFGLRYEVFVQELHWVSENKEKMEVDDYDNIGTNVGIFDDNGVLIGNVRLINAPQPFMVEKEFACMLSPDKPFVKTNEMMESTRICIKKEFRNLFVDGLSIVYLVYKAMYQWSLYFNKRYLVAVIEKRYYLLLKRQGLPFKLLGDFITMPDGVDCCVVTMDWFEFENVLKEKKPDVFKWFSTGVDVP